MHHISKLFLLFAPAPENFFEKIQPAWVFFAQYLNQDMKHPTKCTDEELKAAILGTPAQREAAFICLYSKEAGWRSWVIGHVKSHSGNDQDGEDVFQESVILFDKGIRSGMPRSNVKLRTYFYGVAKWVWFNILRKQKRIEYIPEIPELAGEDIEKLILEEERKRIIYGIIAQMDDTCRKLLPLWMRSYANEEIAKELGLSSEELANKYAYRCREKFKKFLRGGGGLK